MYKRQTVSLLTQQVLSTALSLGQRVVAVAVACDEEERTKILEHWATWDPGVALEVLVNPQRSLVRSVVKYVESLAGEDVIMAVLIIEIQPQKKRHEILHNQRGALLAAALRSRTDVVVATQPFRLHE